MGEAAPKFFRNESNPKYLVKCNNSAEIFYPKWSLLFYLEPTLLAVLVGFPRHVKIYVKPIQLLYLHNTAEKHKVKLTFVACLLTVGVKHFILSTPVLVTDPWPM